MSVDIEREAWTISTRSSAPSKVRRAVSETTIRFVYICLSWHANNEGIAYPSLATIARETALDERTVRVAIDKLIERELVELDHRGGRHQGANHYRILTNSTGQQCPPETDPQPGNSAHLSETINRAPSPSQPGTLASQPGNSAHQTPKNANRTPAPTPTYLESSAAPAGPESGRQALPEHLAELRSRGVMKPTEFSQLDPVRVRQLLNDWDADPQAGPGALVTRLRDLAAGRGYTPTAAPAALSEAQARLQRTQQRLARIQAGQHDETQHLLTA